MGDPKETIHALLMDYYKNKGITPALQVAHELLKQSVQGCPEDNMSAAELNAVFNGEVGETVLQIMIMDFMKRNPKRTESWRYNKSVILSDLDSQSNKFLTEIDALLLTPECIYVFECKSYSGDKKLTGKGVIVRSNGNNCDVYSQNQLHLKILRQWLNRFSRRPVYQMVLFDFSSGSMTDTRDATAKRELPCVNENTLFDLLREEHLQVWRPQDLDEISKQFDRETKALRAKHLDYVKSLKH